MTLLKIVVALETRCNELCVVNAAVLVRIDNTHGFHEFIFRDIDLWDVLQARLEFLIGQRAISILVHFREGRTQSSDLIFGDARRD